MTIHVSSEFERMLNYRSKALVFLLFLVACQTSLAKIYFIRLQDQPHLFALPARADESAQVALENYKLFIERDSHLSREPGADKIRSMRISEVVQVSPEKMPSLLVLANRFYDQTLVQKTAAMLRINRIAESLKGKSQMVVWPVAATARFSHSKRQQIESEAIRHFDGVLALGGADVDPTLYGEPNLDARHTNLKRDQFEIQFLKRWLHSANKLVLGICRGHQLVATALGFKLRQHIEGHGDGEWLKHELHFTNLRNNRLRDLFGNQQPLVSSFHHQSVHEESNLMDEKPWKDTRSESMNREVEVSARASDGTVEALQSSDGQILTFQFHPELMRDRAGRKIFQLVNSALYNRFQQRQFNSKHSCDLLF